MEIKISKMTLADVEDITPQLQTSFDDFWTTSLLKEEVEKKDNLCLVAKKNKMIIGFACIWFSIDDVHIMNLVTHINFRHQGVASQLLEEILIQVPDKPLTLEVRASNTVAIHLYENYGFKKIGIRKQYYTYNNKTEDAIIMTR